MAFHLHLETLPGRETTPPGFVSRAVVLLLCAVGGMSIFSRPAAAAPPPRVVVLSISGEVNPALAAYLRRAFRDAPTGDDVRIVLEIDTFGGRVDSALDMVDAIVNDAPAPTVAYVKTKAISAGALVALACDQLVMRRHTTLGDCAPISYSGGGPKELGEKFQSPLRAKFRALARRNGYSEVLAEAMVTKGMEVHEVVIDGVKRFLESHDLETLPSEEAARITSKRVVVTGNELLTMTDEEAHELGFSKMSVANLDEALGRLYGETVDPLRIDPSWSEGLVRLLSKMAPILLLVGLAALYLEIKSPGFGVSGIVGIACLGVLFLSQYLVGLADHTELLLFGAGLVLLGFEVFVIPGFGLAGVSGITLIAVGAVLGMQGFVVPDPALPWQGDLLVHNGVLVLGAVLGSFLLSLTALRYVLPRLSRVVEGPYLETTLRAAHADTRDTLGVSVGNRGTAHTLLRPAGKMKVGTRVLDVVTRGEYIERGTAIRVSEIRGNTIVVVREGEDVR